jgi:uncharacterized protein DUF6688
MSVDAIQEIEMQEPAVDLPFPASTSGRIIYGLFITLVPAFSFVATALLKPLWQDAKLSSYIMLLLFPRASLGFIALLAYSILCYLLLLFEPARYAQKFIVRAGIYTGVLLALHFSILILIYALDEHAYVIFLAWIFPVVFPPLYRWVASFEAFAKIRNIVFGFIVIAALIIGLFSGGNITMLFVMALVIAAPFWSFLLALRTAIWLYKTHETGFTLQRGLGLTAWLAVYFGAWRYDILKMYELYAQLPKRPPDCYIATAAAKGHPQFVGVRQIYTTNGTVMRVNQQLQILKCFELALLTVSPLVHKTFRSVYDVVGKALAQKIQNPFLADLAYLLLKPFEWLAKMVLKVFIPEIDSVASQIYRR